MNKHLAWSCTLALLLSSGAAGIGQAGIPCFYDWTTAPRQHFMIADSPEYKSILTACRQGRSETVQWDQYIRDFQRAVDMRALSGDAQTNLVRLVEMLRKERDHLSAAQTVRRAIESSNAPPPVADSDARSLDIGPMINQQARLPDRYTVDPVFRSWVPQYLREMVASRVRTEARIVHFEGEATIRRDDKIRNVSDLLMRGNIWNLHGGDIIELRRGRLAIDFGGGDLFEVRPGTGIAVGFLQQCITLRNAYTGSRIDNRGLYKTGLYLLEGTLLYTTTVHDVRVSCPVAVPGHAIGRRGTSFTVTHSPSEHGGTLLVTVDSGEVVVENHTTGENTTLRAGQSHGGTYSRPVPPSATTYQYDWDVQNNCTRDLDFRLFEVNSRDEVVGSWKPVSFVAGERRRVPIRPTPGGKVCWGAGTRDGTLNWGLGLDGSGTCERCCSQTLEATAGLMRSANLTCPGK